MLQMARDAGIQTEEREIDRTELYVADEAFFCGTGVQIAWIETIDGRPVGKGQIGPITTRLRTAFFDTVRGRSPRYAEWLTRVRVHASAARGAVAGRR
jgi:branched-chain amino acid aminotransferase